MKKVFTIALLIFNFSLFTLSCKGQNYYAVQPGSWGDNTEVWSTQSLSGDACGCNPGATITGSTIITIGNNVLSSNTLTSISGTSGMLINDGDSLTIRTSNLDMSSAASIIVNGTLILYGQLSMSGTTAITVNGTGHVVIFGNVSNSGSARVTNNGSFLVRGTVTKTGNAVFNGASQSFETDVVRGTKNAIH